jgi:hypothetical protein
MGTGAVWENPTRGIPVRYPIHNQYKLLSHTNWMPSKVATVVNVSKTFDTMLQTLTSCQIMTNQLHSFLTDQLLLGHIHARPCLILQVFAKLHLIGQEFPVYFENQI